MAKYPAIYAMRHGETDDNLRDVITGQADSPLTALGRDEARAKGLLLRQRIVDLKPVNFIASPLHRACVTMELARVAAKLNSSFYATDPRLMEMNFGDWTKLREGDDRYDENGPTAHENWHLRPPNGESQSELYERVGKFIASIERPVAIVCHAQVISMIQGHVLKLDPQDIMSLKPPNAGVLVLADGKGAWI